MTLTVPISAKMRTDWTLADSSAKRATMTAATTTAPNSFRASPTNGHFGQFGGRYVAETLMPLILELEREYTRTPRRIPPSTPSSSICSRIMSAARARSISPRA